MEMEMNYNYSVIKLVSLWQVASGFGFSSPNRNRNYLLTKCTKKKKQTPKKQPIKLGINKLMNY